MMRRARRVLRWVAILGAVVVGIGGGYLEWRFAAGQRGADQAWRDETPVRLHGVGATRTLAVLPLVDWYAAGPELRGEPGVSYLVKTDRSTILFDVGANLGDLDPSPLIANMRRLGVSLSDIDAVVLSHDHMDHVGGWRFAGHATFSLGRDQVSLQGKRIHTPVPMTYPGSTPVTTRGPTVIAPGVATTGTIARQLYMGRVEEQALAIHLQGRGIVLVVGCGHQTLDKLLARAAQLFAEPVYGVIGGLHYPVPQGRWRTAGLDVQRLVVFGPFRGPTEADVEKNIALLARHGPGWVSLSAHDSSDEAIAAFRRTFGAKYHDLRVGDWQVLASEAPAR